MNVLEKFGQFFIICLRDRLLEQNEMLLEGRLKAKSLQNLQARVLDLSVDQKKLIRDVVVDAVDTAIHDVLFAIQDAHDRNVGIEILVDGVNIAEASGMLNGEHLGEDGWIRRYSRFP